LLQPSVAVTVKIWVFSQVPVISPATAVITGVPQLSVAEEAASTLATVGSVAGLQPKASPVLGTVSSGATASSLQV
jgi:hypothetical protein